MPLKPSGPMWKTRKNIASHTRILQNVNFHFQSRRPTIFVLGGFTVYARACTWKLPRAARTWNVARCFLKCARFSAGLLPLKALLILSIVSFMMASCQSGCWNWTLQLKDRYCRKNPYLFKDWSTHRHCICSQEIWTPFPLKVSKGFDVIHHRGHTQTNVHCKTSP